MSVIRAVYKSNVKFLSKCYNIFRIRSDHNEDDSIEITKTWLKRVEKLYHNVDFAFDETEKTFNLSTNNVDWSIDRFSHIISLREEAIEFARKSWADFIFVSSLIKVN